VSIFDNARRRCSRNPTSLWGGHGPKASARGGRTPPSRDGGTCRSKLCENPVVTGGPGKNVGGGLPTARDSRTSGVPSASRPRRRPQLPIGGHEDRGRARRSVAVFRRCDATKQQQQAAFSWRRSANVVVRRYVVWCGNSRVLNECKNAGGLAEASPG
jgi:hypothetical protein